MYFTTDHGMAFRSASRDDGNEGTIAGVLFSIFLLVVIVTVVAIVLIRRKRKTQNSGYPPAVQIHFENRQP